MQRRNKKNVKSAGMQSIAKYLLKTPKKVDETPERKRKLSSSSSSDGEKTEISKNQNLKKTRVSEFKSPNGNKPSLSKLKSSPQKYVDPLSYFGGETSRIETNKLGKPQNENSKELRDKSLIGMDIEENVVDKQKISIGVTSQEYKIKVEDDVRSPRKEDKKLKKGGHSSRVKDAKSDLDSSVLTDEERFERKRWVMMNYQKYKNRPSCINPGSKEVPKGKPNCLSGLHFLITGVLESLDRDEADAIIKEYGGKTMKTLSKKLNYVIVGEEAGPAKLAKAEEFNIPTITEDQFFDLIREKSGQNTNKKVSSKLVKSPEKPIKKEKTTSPKIEKSPEKKIKKEKLSPIKKRSETKNEQLTPKKIKREETNNVADIQHQIKSEVPENTLAWVDKYKPTTIKEIIGQQGAASNVNKLINWLSKWYTNHDGKTKPKKANPWAKNDDGSFYKAALLSGPPGVGKTTTATIVCKELGFDTVEFNASDTRSKRLLKEEVAEILSTKSLYGFCHGEKQALTKKHVLLMDEVDGMAGNEDRGGIQELIALIKESRIPIICMCNDRNHQKIRSLVNYCYDLRFNRPQLVQIKARILSICCREKFKLEPSKIEEIISATNHDIRQSINHIFLLSAGKELKLEGAQQEKKTAQKDLKLGPWDVVRKVFSSDDHKAMSFNDKCDLFFNDYSLGPLFVQHNYLRVSPVGPKIDVLRKVALTADSLSLGDVVEKRIRGNSAWSLLPTQAIFSSVLPGEYMSGHFIGRIDFPGWLGKNSKANKRCRLAQEIHDHTRLCTSGSRLSIRLDYAPFLLSKIVEPMKNKGADGVRDSLNTLKQYHLLREDIDSLIELTSWPGKKSIMDGVNGRVNAALTRSYNNEVPDYIYSTSAGIKKKKSTEQVKNTEDFIDDEEEEENVIEEMVAFDNY